MAIAWSDEVPVGTIFTFVGFNPFSKEGTHFKIVERHRPKSKRGEFIVSTVSTETIIACDLRGKLSGARKHKISLAEINIAGPIKVVA